MVQATFRAKLNNAHGYAYVSFAFIVLVFVYIGLDVQYLGVIVRTFRLLLISKNLRVSECHQKILALTAKSRLLVCLWQITKCNSHFYQY